MRIDRLFKETKIDRSNCSHEKSDVGICLKCGEPYKEFRLSAEYVEDMLASLGINQEEKL